MEKYVAVTGSNVPPTQCAKAIPLEILLWNKSFRQNSERSRPVNYITDEDRVPQSLIAVSMAGYAFCELR